MQEPAPSGPEAPGIVHVPVLLAEAVDLLAPRSGGVYVDGTLGGGGHAAAILARASPDGVVVGIDRDRDALARSAAALASFGARAIIRHGNFRDLPDLLAELGIAAVDGVLIDLGVSWFHLRTPERGFSFQQDGPLDMRMDTRTQRTAADLVNTLPRRELAALIREYGEDPRAAAIARAIERARERGPITRTLQLAEIISRQYPPARPRRVHPATLTFQALRIAVNEELDSLREGLDRIIGLLRPGGRVAAITFHSLEDRIVKQAFVREAKGCICPPRMPVCSCGMRPRLRVLTPRPVLPGEDEVANNPAARSAKLRGAEKLA